MALQTPPKMDYNFTPYLLSLKCCILMYLFTYKHLKMLTISVKVFKTKIIWPTHSISFKSSLKKIKISMMMRFQIRIKFLKNIQKIKSMNQNKQKQSKSSNQLSTPSFLLAKLILNKHLSFINTEI